MTQSSETKQALLEQRVDNMEGLIVQLVQTNKNIDESLQRLVGLEVRHDQTRDSINKALVRLDDHEERILDMEQKKQFWTMSSQALWLGLLAAFGLMFTFMWQISTEKTEALNQYRDTILQEAGRERSK